MEVSRQEYWSWWPFPPPEDIPDPGSNPHLLHWQVDTSPLHYLGHLLNNYREEEINTSPLEGDGDQVVFDLTLSPFSTIGA